MTTRHCGVSHPFFWPILGMAKEPPPAQQKFEPSSFRKISESMAIAPEEGHSRHIYYTERRTSAYDKISRRCRSKLDRPMERTSTFTGVRLPPWPYINGGIRRCASTGSAGNS